MPVTPNFYVSHQWLRELRRWGAGTMVGVYFRIPDDEPVWVGHYGQAHVRMTAAQATALMMGRGAGNEDETSEVGDGSGGDERQSSRRPEPLEGYEVIIERPVEVKEILRVRLLRQVTGWRYMPGAHGRPPCTCLCCGGRGQYGVRKLLRAVEEAEAGGKPTKVIVFGRGDASDRRVERLRRERGLRGKTVSRNPDA